MSRALRTIPRTPAWWSRLVPFTSSHRHEPSRCCQRSSTERDPRCSSSSAWKTCALCASPSWTSAQPAGPDQPVRLVAEHRLDRGAHVPDRAVGLEHEDDVGSVLHERPEALLARAEPLLLARQPAVARARAAGRGSRASRRPRRRGPREPRRSRREPDGSAPARRRTCRPRARWPGSPLRARPAAQRPAPGRGAPREAARRPRPRRPAAPAPRRATRLDGRGDRPRGAGSGRTCDASLVTIERVQVEGELPSRLAEPAGQLGAAARVQDRLALDDVLLGDSLLHLCHQEERATVGRSLLDEEEAADGREPGDGKRDHQRETSRQVERRPGGATLGPPGIARPLGACGRHPRPRPDGSERPAASSPLHRLSHAEVEGSRGLPGTVRGLGKSRARVNPRKRGGRSDDSDARWPEAASDRDRRRGLGSVRSRTDKLTCDEMPRPAPKIVTRETPHRAGPAPRSRGGSERPRQSRDPEQESESPARQRHAHDCRHRPAPGDRLLHEHDRGQAPASSRGERRRRRTSRASGPSSTHAVHPVEGADPERPERSRAAPPVLDHEADRRAALAEA